MEIICAASLAVLELGKRGTHRTRAIRFDVAEWQREYPDGTIFVLHKRPGEAYPTPVSYTETGDGTMDWIISSGDVAVVGYGQCELVLMDKAGHRAKEITFSTHISESLCPADTEPPAAETGWIEQVMAAAMDAQYYAGLAQQGAEKSGFAFFDVRDSDGKLYVIVSDKLDKDVQFAVNEENGNLEVTVNG